jgi:polyamine oxidase
VAAGTRVDKSLVDVSSRTGYQLVKAKPQDAHARAAEYYQFDWEYAQTPEQSSMIASSWGNNFTYDTDQGGFSDDNRMSIDQRGFKSIIQLEAAEFLKASQQRLNSTVKTVAYSKTGVTVTLTNGKKLSADYALCTFSLGVLQNDDVVFSPELPDWKQEAIQSMNMATYTKIFLRFPKKFWFDTEMAIFADSERGRYPVWQSLDHENFFPGSGIIFVTVTGDFSERIEGLPNAQVQSEVMGVVRSMFPNVTVPEPTDFFFPRWHTNPLFRGSYSNWGPSFTSQHMDNLRANVGRLNFAGEATSRKYFGFLHGAYFEGLNIGGRIAKCIKGKSCPNMESFLQVTNSIPYEMNR